MRVQHNIASMNSYRNYNNNTSMINKNLEKLSSGYKINRAGDDAAGLAISEKMRAQIVGLEGAQKNAKAGINLVQTAESALTEVHSMLDRMYDLAEQSANGTYDKDTDRTQLQKEIEQLRTEINRIADSTNYNGITLLDGSLGGNSQVKNLAVTESSALKGKYTSGVMKAINTDFSDSLTTDDIGKSMDLTVTWKTGSGVETTTTVSLTFRGTGKGTVDADTPENNYFTDANGTHYELDSDGKLSQAQLTGAFKAGLERNEEFAAAFDVKVDTNAFVFEAKTAGASGASIVGLGVSEDFSVDKDTVWGAGQTVDNDVDVTVAPLNAMQKIDATKLKVAVSTDTDVEDLQAKIFEIDGNKFLVANNTLTNNQVKSLSDDVTIIQLGTAATSVNAAALTQKVAADITRVTGLTTDVLTTTPPTGSNITQDTDILFTSDHLRLSGSALTLQIGDTAASYNQLNVQIGDIHANMLGSDDLKLNAIDISEQGSAQAAMDAIKAAINSVSDIRGTLGATQNRLDHTINNLSVMQENIQDAESTIRDTDVADEMMKYTKNSILVQSAQAMLAQANQQPQGVLQLLQ